MRYVRRRHRPIYARYRVTITLIEDTCIVPYSNPCWWRGTVEISHASLQLIFAALRRLEQRPNGVVWWDQVREHVVMC